MTSIKLVLLTISLSFIVKETDSAKILHISYIGCKSTYSMHQAIDKILLNNHHEIIAISPLPFGQAHPNYTDLGAQDAFYQFSDQFSIEDEYFGTYINRKAGYDIQIASCEKIYQNTKVVEILKKINVDLILLEIDAAECYWPLLAHFQVPMIGVSTQNVLFPDIDGIMGSPANPSYVPTSMSGFSTRMNFVQRLQNAKDYVLHLAIAWYYTNEANTMIEKEFGSRPKEELFDRISLVFFNGHTGFLPKPLAPSTIDISGIHIGNTSPLPKTIQEFIEGATKGVIYLSLGSVAKFSGLPKHIHASFVKIMQKSEYRVIWRHDKPEMVPNTSGNILVQKWLPQRDILAHPKVIMFISHSGIFSTYEAIHFGVPMLTFPVLYDQFTNAAITENLEIGMTQDLRNFNEKSLESGIEEVIQNEKYRKNMKKLSQIFRDRPLTPQDTLIYWVNYVLRHQDVSHLKPFGAKLPFYQYLLLDIILFVIATLAISSWLIYLTLKMMASLFTKLFVKKSTIRKSKKS